MKIIWVITLLILVAGCTTGNCRTVSDAKKATLEASQTPHTEIQVPDVSNSKTRVAVFKYDGSLQCGMGKTISVDEMKKDLKQIQVFRSENKSDNLMHIQLCGSPTGRANVYEIDRSQLEAAKKLGFQEWTFE